MEPVGAHRLPPVARYHPNPATAVRSTRPYIGFVRVDRIVPGQHHRPTVVIELTWKEKGLCVAVALGRVVSVMLVGRDCVQTKAEVRRRVDRKRVVVTHQNRFPITRHEQFGRECPIEGPQRVRFLVGEVRMESNGYSISRSIEPFDPPHSVMIQPPRSEFPYPVSMHLFLVAKTFVDARADLRGLEVNLGVKLVPPLMGPVFSWRSPLCWRII